MSETVLHTSASMQSVERALLQNLPVALIGRSPAARNMLTVAGMAIKTRIFVAFVTKASGGRDEAGESWLPLHPQTIAYRHLRRRDRGPRKKTYPSSGISEDERALWRRVYRRTVANHPLNQFGRGEDGPSPQVKAEAARYAWGLLRARGVQTIFDKYKDSNAEILRDTGLLLKSFSPGIKHSKHAVFRVGPGEVIIGTNRPYAGVHHRGSERIPQRRLWPDPAKWPAPWWADITDAVKAGVVQLIAEILARNK